MCDMQTGEVIAILHAQILEKTWEIPRRCALVACIDLAFVWAQLVVALSLDFACTVDCCHWAGGSVGSLHATEVVMLRMILLGARDLPDVSLASCLFHMSVACKADRKKAEEATYDSCVEQCDSGFVCVQQDQRSLSNPRLGLLNC